MNWPKESFLFCALLLLPLVPLHGAPGNSGAFTFTGPLNIARSWHTSTLLADGRVLVVGGYTATGETATAEMYTPNTGAFTRVGSMIHARAQSHTATLLTNGQVLIVGRPIGLYVPRCELFDPATGQFTATGDTTIPIAGHSATLLADGRVLIVGGPDSEQHAEIYNPVARTWTRVADSVHRFWLHSAVRLPNGRVLLANGVWAERDADVFDPVTATFQSAGTFLERRPFGTVSLLENGLVLNAGGSDVAGRSAEWFNPGTGTSTNLGLLNVARTSHTAAVLTNGDVLLCGGTTPAGDLLRSAEVFEPATRSFRGTGSLGTPRVAHTATTLLDGRVVIIGGQDANQLRIGTAELYNPAASNALPFISVVDTNVSEGNALTNELSFAVQLSKAHSATVAVEFATSALTAFAPWDYTTVTGRVTFPPGVTNQFIRVPIVPDSSYEPDEAVLLTLRSTTITNGIVARGQAIGTILNDDPYPVLNVTGTSVAEGDRGVSFLGFDVVLSNPSQDDVRVSYRTIDGTAQAGDDYLAVSNVLFIPAGLISQRVMFQVIGDLAVESNETVFLQLSSPTNAAIGASLPATIENDDGIPGVLHHFAIAPIASPQFVGFPTNVAIVAQDISNQTVNYSGQVDLFIAATNPATVTDDFNDESLDRWVPLNAGPAPGPYQVVNFDIDGDGRNSPAFRIEPEKAAHDGIARDVPLNAGTKYRVSCNLAQVNEQSVYGGGGVDFWLRVNGQTFSQLFPYYIPPGYTNYNRFYAEFTPPTNGLYRIELLFSRSTVDPGTAAYLDDFEIRPRPMDTRVADFVAGVAWPSIAWNVGLTNVMLMVRDGFGRTAVSNPFDVWNAVDLSVTGALNLGARVGRNVDWTVEVANNSLLPASGVRFTNWVPSGITVVSATTTNGACAVSGEVVSCDLGVLSPGTVARVRFLGATTNEGTYTNLAIVQVNEFDPYLSNNTNRLIMTVLPVEVMVGDDPLVSHAFSARENPAGTNLAFPVMLLAPRTNTVTVDFYTASTAGALPGIDYVPTNGTLVFAPGVTQQFVYVTILDDQVDEADEFLQLYLTNGVNASVNPQPGSGVILDNGDSPSVVAIADAALVEGDAGPTNMLFRVTIEPPSGRWISFRYLTVAGTAVIGDFNGINSELTIPPYTSNATIAITIQGNTVNEPDETFQVRLTNAVNCTFARAVATGTILNDDAVPGRFDHFVFAPIASPQVIGRGIPLTVRAVDAFEQTISNYAGVVAFGALSGTNYFSANVVPDTVSNFVNGVATATANFSVARTSVVIYVNDSQQHIGYSNPFDVRTAFPLTVQLPAEATEGDGLLAGAGRVILGVPQEQPVTVTLTGNSELWVQPSVIVPAGQTNATFDVMPMDDEAYDGSRAGSVTATAPYFFQSTAYVLVHDNEHGVVTVSLPASAREGDGSVPFSVTVWPSNHTGLNFSFSNSAPGEISVPGNVGFSAGATSLVTGATVIDDGRLDGTQLATITAAVSNWTVIPATIAIADNESTNLTFTFGWQGQPREGSGTITNFRLVRIAGTLPTNLTVALTSSDPGELILPPSVTIPAGQLVAGIDATFPQDDLFDGTQNVTMTGSAAGFRTATAVVAVGDDEVHQLAVQTTFKSPALLGSSVVIQITARDINGTNISGLRAPVSLSATGDHGAVTFSVVDAQTPVQTDSRIAIMFATVDTNVRLIASLSNGASGISGPFDVAAPPLQIARLGATDLAYDAVGARLYAAVPTNAALRRIKPDTGEGDGAINVGFNPALVAVDDQGRFAYVSGTNGVVRRFRLDTGWSDLDWLVGPAGSVIDLAVMPGQPEVVAVSRASTLGADVVIYDHGLARPVTLTNVSLPARLEFGGTSNRLFVLSDSTNGMALWRCEVWSNGVFALSSTNGLSAAATDFVSGGSRVFSNGGDVRDAETGAVAGSLPWTGAVAVDSSIGRVFFAHSSGNGWQLEVLGESSLQNIGQLSLTGISAVTKLVRCGGASLAFISAQGLGFLHTPFISDTDADGLPDAWEREFFGTIAGPDATAGADPDGDGRTNLQEFQSGTDPANAASVLRVVNFGVGTQTNVITFSTVVGKRYRVVRARTLSTVWTSIADQIVGTGGAVSVSDTNSASHAESYYRVFQLP